MISGGAVTDLKTSVMDLKPGTKIPGFRHATSRSSVGFFEHTQITVKNNQLAAAIASQIITSSGVKLTVSEDQLVMGLTDKAVPCPRKVIDLVGQLISIMLPNGLFRYERFYLAPLDGQRLISLEMSDLYCVSETPALGYIVCR